MRQVEKFRIDQSGSASNEGREIVLHASLLDDSTTARDKPSSATAGGDVIAGLRNGLMLSAAFWLIAYFVVQLIVR